MGIRNIPRPVLICFAIGFVVGAVTLSTVYWMIARGNWESEPVWVFLVCPASIGLMALPYDPRPIASIDYIELVAIVAFMNGILFSGIGELIGFFKGKFQKRSDQSKPSAPSPPEGG